MIGPQLKTALAWVVVLSITLPAPAAAARWEVRREVREGARAVGREKREAFRELQRCTTRDCARREVREGHREVAREKREARREIKREVRQDYYDNFYRGNGRWYRDGRWWDRNDYERRYFYRDDDGAGKIIAGVAIGAAVVGVAAAIADADD
jgi:hypothetical protein